MSYARWYKVQWLYTKQRFAKGVQRNINWAHFMAIIFLRCWGSWFVQCCFPTYDANQGWLLCANSIHKSRSPLPHQKKKTAHKRAKYLKARKVSHLFPSSWVLRWVFGGKMLWKLSFWAIWRSLRKLDDFTLRDERQHLNTLISMDNSKLHSHAISGLSQAKKARFRRRTFKSRT